MNEARLPGDRDHVDPVSPATSGLRDEDQTAGDDRAPAADPARRATAWELGLSAQRAGELEVAAAHFLDCPPDPVRGRAPALFHAAWCLEQARQPEQAGSHYAQVVEQTSEPALSIEAQFRLGWLALGEGDVERAGRNLACLLDLATAHGLTGPTVEHASYWFAFCLESEGRLVEAAERYGPIVAAGNPDLWHEAAYRRLLCLSQVGDLNGAFAAAGALLQPPAAVRDPQRLQALQALAREEQAQIVRARAMA